MNPREVFCPNHECPARGQTNKGNIWIHSRKDKRYKCKVCQRTFRETQGTLFHGLKTDDETVQLVLELLAYGCPLVAIVKAFKRDERTVKSWLLRAGAQCEAVHAHVVMTQSLDLVHIQADEIKVKCQGRSVWMALAMMVSTRLWLGGVVSPERDSALIQQLFAPLRTLARCAPLLVCVDGFRSYVKVTQKTFRSPLPRNGRSGRCKWVAWPEVAIAQVVKTRLVRGLELAHRIEQGSAEQVATLLTRSKGGTKINTAYIERLNATFRQRLAPLARRTRSLARQTETLTAGMWLTGTFYNFCTAHESLRLAHKPTDGDRERTPAMAAGLTDHLWTPHELLAYRIPPPRWSPPKAIGRPSNATRRLVKEWCSDSTG